MPACTQVVGHMVGPDDELRVDIECGKGARWKWRNAPTDSEPDVCDDCRETYRAADAELFAELELVEVPS
jgi:hypothetical protein